MERLRGLQRRRQKTGAGFVISLVIHGLVFAAAFFVARGMARVVLDEPKPTLTFHSPPPPPPPKGRKRTTPKKDIKKEIIKPKQEMIIPKEIPKEVPEPAAEEAPMEEDEPEGEEFGVEGGVEGGVVGGVVGGVLGGQLGSTLPIPEPDLPDVAREITMGISTPKVIRKLPPEYPAVAQRAGVEGEVILRCIIDTKGDVKVDKVLKAPSLLEDAAIRAVQRWKYEPAIYKGRPQAVYLIVRLNFVRPKK